MIEGVAVSLPQCHWASLSLALNSRVLPFPLSKLHYSGAVTPWATMVAGGKHQHMNPRSEGKHVRIFIHTFWPTQKSGPKMPGRTVLFVLR